MDANIHNVYRIEIENKGHLLMGTTYTREIRIKSVDSDTGKSTVFKLTLFSKGKVGISKLDD